MLKLANYIGGYALIDFGGQVVSTTPITIAGAYEQIKSGKPIVFQNIKFDADLPGVTVVVSMGSWDSADPDSNYMAIFGETLIYITAEDSVYIPE